MELDTRTTIFAGFIIAVLLAGTALAFSRSAPVAMRLAAPLRLWGYALLALALGLAAVASRAAIPPFLSIIAGNTLIVASLVLSYRSLRAFRGLPPADATGWILVAAVFVLLWVFLEIWPNLGARIALLSAVRAFLLARNAVELARD